MKRITKIIVFAGVCVSENLRWFVLLFFHDYQIHFLWVKERLKHQCAFLQRLSQQFFADIGIIYLPVYFLTLFLCDYSALTILSCLLCHRHFCVLICQPSKIYVRIDIRHTYSTHRFRQRQFHRFDFSP